MSTLTLTDTEQRLLKAALADYAWSLAEACSDRQTKMQKATTAGNEVAASHHRRARNECAELHDATRALLHKVRVL